MCSYVCGYDWQHQYQCPGCTPVSTFCVLVAIYVCALLSGMALITTGAVLNITHTGDWSASMISYGTGVVIVVCACLAMIIIACYRARLAAQLAALDQAELQYRRQPAYVPEVTVTVSPSTSFHEMSTSLPSQPPAFPAPSAPDNTHLVE